MGTPSSSRFAHEDGHDEGIVRPPVNFVNPAELKAELESTLSITSDGLGSASELLAQIQHVMRRSVTMGDRVVLNQLFHRPDVVAVLGDWLTAALNTSVYTFEIAPVATLLEMECIAKYAALCGWDPAGAEGCFPPGGSTSNLYGLCFARQRAFPEARETGWAALGVDPVLFVSAAGHYSSLKSAMLMGLGARTVVEVPVDESTGRMDVAALEAKMVAATEAGRTPFCVVATAGTTLTGAIDPIAAIADVCERHRVWLHVDGCLGGSLLHSPTARAELAGIDRADSFAVNAHKMMGVTLQCSAILTRHKGIMRETFSTKAAYLFNDDKEYDGDYDVGDGLFMCGRRPDCVKLWLTWRFRGDAGMGAYVDRALTMHRLFNATLAADGRFVAVLEETSAVPCTCFWYVPRRWRNGGAAMMVQREDICAKDSDLFRAIDRCVPRAKMALMQRGQALLTMSRLPGKPNFWRFVADGAHEWTPADIQQLLLDPVAAACEEYVD